MAKKVTLKKLIIDGDDTHHALVQLRDCHGKVVAHELVGATDDDGLGDRIGEAIKELVDNHPIWVGQSIDVEQFDVA